MNPTKLFLSLSGLLLVLLVKISYAGQPLIIADIAITQQQLNQKKPVKTSELHQFGGYINSVYVRFNVEIHNNQVVGQIFDAQGQARYIYGEFYKGVLTIYDQNNTNYSVLLDKDTMKAFFSHCPSLYCK